MRSLDADHILITGDLTTTALPAEFQAARAALADWLDDPARVTIIPGNHDRYTLEPIARAASSITSASFLPGCRTRGCGGSTPRRRSWGSTRPARASRPAENFPRAQIAHAQEFLARPGSRRLLIACHYPVAVPAEFEREYAQKPLVNRLKLAEWLRTIGPHIYCCGHVHAAWAYQPDAIPDQLCLNPGAPLLRDTTGRRPPGFLEILLEDGDVAVHHHAWTGESWEVRLLRHAPISSRKTRQGIDRSRIK